MEKFAGKVKTGGVLLYDSSTIIHAIERTDITIIGIDATTEAIQMKNPRIMNMLMLGAYLQLKPIVAVDDIMKALEKVLPEKYHHLLPVNRQAMERGAGLVKLQLEQTKKLVAVS